jgi:hypothetical protein
MRALVLEEFGGPFIAKDVPMPTIAPHEALVRVRNRGRPPASCARRWAGAARWSAGYGVRMFTMGYAARKRIVSPVPFVPDVAPLVVSVVVRLGVRALPRASAAPVVAGAPAPFAVPAPDAVRGRVIIRVTRINRDRYDAGGQERRSSANHRPSRLHKTLLVLRHPSYFSP